MKPASLHLLSLSLLCTSALLLSACGGTDDPQEMSQADAGDPVTGDWLVVHESGEPATLNPYLEAAGAGSVQIVNQNIFETLLKRDYDLFVSVDVCHLPASWRSPLAARGESAIRAM